MTCCEVDVTIKAGTHVGRRDGIGTCRVRPAVAGARGGSVDGGRGGVLVRLTPLAEGEPEAMRGCHWPPSSVLRPSRPSAGNCGGGGKGASPSPPPVQPTPPSPPPLGRGKWVSKHVQLHTHTQAMRIHILTMMTVCNFYINHDIRCHCNKPIPPSRTAATLPRVAN